jgi:hypothetical protein
MIIGVAFHFYAVYFGADALDYWEKPKELAFSKIIEIIEQGSASGILYLINYIPSNILNLSFFTGNMCYGLFGYLGFLYIFKISNELFPDLLGLKEFRIFGISLYPWIWFLPNFHFWSSGIGKDTLLFTAIIIFIYSFRKISKRSFLFLVSIFLSFSIRPHILLFLILSFAIGYMFEGKLKAYQKIFLFLLLIVGFGSIFKYVLNFIQLDTLDIHSVDDYVSTKAANLNQTDSGSGIDTSNYSIIGKIFTFLYRPLFFDSPNLLGIISSLENVILITVSFKVLFLRPLKSLKRSNALIKSIFIFFLISTLAFSLILGNLGIMLRQKNMIMPVFILVSFGFFYIHKYSIQTK